MLLYTYTSAWAQTEVYFSGQKWGIRENGALIVPAVYDTVLGFDATGRVCLGCYRTKVITNRNSFKITRTDYACHYLNRKNEKLVIRIPGNDTCSVFSLGKLSYSQYRDSGNYFVAGTKGSRYLVRKDFSQATFHPYHSIRPTAEPGFFITEALNEFDVPYTGLISSAERTVVPHQYSHIRINPYDSLIIACSAGLPATTDAVYNYEGNKIKSSGRHIHTATRDFIIYKVFEPKEYFILAGIDSAEETRLEADELEASGGNEVRIQAGTETYFYNLETRQKTNIKKDRTWKE